MKAGAQYAPEPYPYRAMNVQLQRVFEAFGPQRCYWETDITQTLIEGEYAIAMTEAEAAFTWSTSCR